MADVHNRTQRRRNMSAIRGRDTKPEVVLRRLLHRRGLRYRLHDTGLPGKPDLVFPQFNAVLFVHGCFWHQHSNCKIASLPKTNVEFWTKKLSGNKERDFRNYRELVTSGWRVGVIWECATRKKEFDLDRLVNNILGSDSWEIPEPFYKSSSLRVLSSELF